MKAPSSHKTLKQIEGSHKPPAQNQLDDISINIGVGVSLCLWKTCPGDQSTW